MPTAVACKETIELVTWLALYVGRFPKTFGTLARSKTPCFVQPAHFAPCAMLKVWVSSSVTYARYTRIRDPLKSCHPLSR